jgi:hypothetical protein
MVTLTIFVTLNTTHATFCYYGHCGVVMLEAGWNWSNGTCVISVEKKRNFIFFFGCGACRAIINRRCAYILLLLLQRVLQSWFELDWANGGCALYCMKRGVLLCKHKSELWCCIVKSKGTKNHPSPRITHLHRARVT